MDEVMKDEVLNEVTDEMIRDWKTCFGKVYKLAADEEDMTLEVYIKKPTRAAISRFQSGVSKKSVSAAAQQFVFDLLLYPSQDTLVKIFVLPQILPRPNCRRTAGAKRKPSGDCQRVDHPGVGFETAGSGRHG